MTDKTRNVVIVILLMLVAGWYVKDSRARAAREDDAAFTAEIQAIMTRVHTPDSHTPPGTTDAVYSAEIIANAIRAAGCR